jgi:hypothetical protein
LRIGASEEWAVQRSLSVCRNATEEAEAEQPTKPKATTNPKPDGRSTGDPA